MDASTKPSRDRSQTRTIEPGAPQQTVGPPFPPEPDPALPEPRATPARTPRKERMPMLDVDKAMKEITRVPAATIHRTAAFAWASRAIAGYRVCTGKSTVPEGLSYLYLGEHYREAALAHAAMGEAWQPLFTEIDDAMADDRSRAFSSLRGLSSGATP